MTTSDLAYVRDWIATACGDHPANIHGRLGDILNRIDSDEFPVYWGTFTDADLDIVLERS